MVNAAFAIRHVDGRWWSGRKWVSDPLSAKLFSQEPDPYARAADVASDLHQCGHDCHVAYLTLESTSQTRTAPPRNRTVAT